METHVFIHGVPCGHKYLDTTKSKEPDQYILSFYRKHTTDVPNAYMVVEIVNGRSYYTYLRVKNYLDKDSRSGSYFAISLRTDAHVFRTQSDIFETLDRAYNNHIVGKVIAPNDKGGGRYLIGDFNEAKSELSNMVAEIFDDIKQQTMIPIPTSNSRSASKEIVTVSFEDADSISIKQQILGGKTIWVSNEYQSEKENISGLSNHIQKLKKELASKSDHLAVQNKELTKSLESSHREIEELKQQIKGRDNEVDALKKQLELYSDKAAVWEGLSSLVKSASNKGPVGDYREISERPNNKKTLIFLIIGVVALFVIGYIYTNRVISAIERNTPSLYHTTNTQGNDSTPQLAKEDTINYNLSRL